MKNLTIKFLILILLVIGIKINNVNAQLNKGDSLQLRYSNLDMKYFPSGILHNTSPFYMYCFNYDSISQQYLFNLNYLPNPYIYQNGSIDMSFSTFNKLYYDLVFSSVRDSVIISPFDYFMQDSIAKLQADFPISIMRMNFHEMDRYALGKCYLWLDSLTEKFTIMPDTIRPPDSLNYPDSVYVLIDNPDSLAYLAFNSYWVHGATARRPFIYTNWISKITDSTNLNLNYTASFSLPQSLFITNDTNYHQKIRVDFDDGNGFTDMFFNQVKQVYYTESVPLDTLIYTPYENIVEQQQQKYITVKLPPIGQGDSLTVKFPITLIINPNPADTTFKTSDLEFECDVIDPGYSVKNALVSIRYADSAYKKLIKPIILSGGFESDLRDYGAIRYEGITSGVICNSDGEKAYEHLNEMHLILDSLHNHGYDIIFIDQQFPRDAIQDNGLALIKLIQWVNKELQINESNEKLIVMGASMGGLIVRYALRMMELQNCCPNTRLYLTFDAPHNGANIPVADQFFVQDLKKFAQKFIPKWNTLNLKEIRQSIISAYDDVLNSPAAQQMLIYHADNSAQSVMLNFYTFLDSIGHPESCRKIAVINGSERGTIMTINDNDKRLMTMDIKPPAPVQYSLLPGKLWNWLAVSYPKQVFDLRAYSESQDPVYESNDIVKATNAYLSILLGYLYFSSKMTALDLMGLSIFKPGIKGIANSSLPWYLLFGTTLNPISNSVYPLNLTIVPGGQNKTQEEVAKAGEGLIAVQTPNHSFIPSISALDINSSNLYMNIHNAYLSDQSITPFDCYWASGRQGGDDNENRNMLHVEVSSFNRAWIKEQILNDWQLRSADGEYKGTLAGYYNYGKPWADQNIQYTNKPYQNILYSLNIENNGILYVNKQDVIGLPNGTLLPRSGSMFLLKTNSDACDTTIVKIKDGGQFIVGEVSGSVKNKALVLFKNNSTLEIFNNGELIINDSSTLVIEEGATLIIHSGATIQLNGQDAVLEIRGKVVIDNNTNFEPLGNGFIRFAANMNSSNYNDFWNVGSGCNLILTDSNSLSKKAEVVSDLFIPDNLNTVLINAKVEIDSMRNIHFFCSLAAQNSMFTALDSTKFYSSVNVYGQANVRFGSCEFKYGYYGLRALMSYGGNSFIIDTCSFIRNYIGLYTSDQHISLNNCKLNNNIDFGWKAENMQSNCEAYKCQFNSNYMTGIKFSSQANAMLNITESEINDNYLGVEISNATLMANCSYFKYSFFAAIFGYENSEINLSSDSRNFIGYNHIGILLYQASRLLLENGWNNFTGNQYYILGVVLPNNYYFTGGSNPIAIDNNLMPVNNSNYLPVNIYFPHPDPQYGNVNISFTGWTSNISSWETICIVFDTTPNYANFSMFQGKISTSVINTTHFPNTYLIDAITTAAMQISSEDYIGNDTLAIILLKEIFDTIPPNLNEDEQWAIEQGLNLMITALTYAIERDLIDPNRAMDGMPVDEYVQMISDEIQARLDDIEYTDLYAQEQEAYYQLLLAQIYRAAEHYDYALAILQNDNYFFNTSLESTAAYWECVCYAENQLLKGYIDRTRYIEITDSCLSFSTARLARFIPIYGETLIKPNEEEENILIVYPNPAENLIAVEFSHAVEQVIVKINDLTGKSIWQTQKVVNGKQLRLKLPDLIPGSYILKTITDDRVYNNKIIIK